MSITATLTMSPNAIAGQPVNGMLTITNAASSDVTVSSIGAVLAPASAPYQFSPVVFPPNKTSTVSASGGTLSVPVQFVFFVPQTAGSQGNGTQPGANYLVGLMVQVSDGSSASPVAQWVSVSSGAPSPSQGYGQLDFTDGLNLINIAVI